MWVATLNCEMATDGHAMAGREVFAGRATFDGWFALANWPTDFVRDFLPSRLRLAEHAGAETHQVLFVFGRQRDTALLYGGAATPVGTDYDEFGIVVPAVCLDDRPDPFSYVPCMYSSSSSATWIGNHIYGLGKRECRVAARRDSWTMMSVDGQVLFHAFLEVTHPGDARGAAAAGLQPVSRVARSPILGARDPDEWVVSCFGWGFADALVRPARALLSVDAPLRGGIGVRRDAVANGCAWQVHGMVWRLSWPQVVSGRHELEGRLVPAGTVRTAR